MTTAAVSVGIARSWFAPLTDVARRGDPPASVRRASLHIALFLSGFAALVYETSWTRMLNRVFGVGDLAVATVLAAFFLGLGLGSWAASRVGHRVERPALVYAVLEGIIAVYAAITPWLVPVAGSAYAAVGGDASIEMVSFLRLGLSLILLLPPTALMGATLPVILLILTQREGWARGVTGLYVANTLGAMAGAGVAGLILLPRLGGRASTWIAAGASVLAAVLVMALHREVRIERAAEPEPEPEEPEPERAPALALAMTLAAGTGGAALAAEVLWTRVLRMVTHGTTQAFSSMLVCYLLGIALGALAARRLAKTRSGPAIALGVTQVLAAVMIVVAMWVAPHLARFVPMLRGELSFVPTHALTLLSLSLMLLLPLALVSGTGLPLVWALGERDDPDAARGSGKLLAANTLGGLVGSLAAGFFLVPAIGLEASLIVVAFVHLGLAGLALRRGTARRAPVLRALALTLPLALGVGMLLSEPEIDFPFLIRAWQEPTRAIVEGPSEHWREDLVFLREGRMTTVTVQRRGGGLTLFNDGRPESGLGPREPGFGAELGLLGSMPVLFAERTERAMAVGLGAGHTTTVLLAGGFERVDVVELEEGVVEAGRWMHQQAERPFPLDDPRTHLIVDDARNRLVLAPADTYDAIVSQPSHPWLAGSSALYTREFFEEADRALRDGGVLAIWINLFRIRPRHIQAVVHTLTEVFPHVSGFIGEASSLVLAASRHPQRYDARFDERIARLAGPVLRHFDLADRSSIARVQEFDSAAARALGEGASTIVDDLPLLEFELAGTPDTAHVTPVDLDRALRDVPWRSVAGSWEGPGRADAITVRIAAVVDRPIALRRIASSLDALDLDAAGRALVEGALAEARGDVRGALTAWDRAAGPAAAARSDRLRLAQGMNRQLLRAGRSGRSAEALPALRAALRIGDEAALRDALDVSRPDGDGHRLRAYVELEAVERCAAWRRDPAATEALARVVGEVAFRAQECAFAGGDREAARRLGTLAVRARRATAEASWEVGERCAAGGNGGCALLMFRRAVIAYPSHSRAAVSLARRLNRVDPAQARAVLMTALHATQGIATSQRRLVLAATELGIDLGVQLPESGPSPTSTEASGGG